METAGTCPGASAQKKAQEAWLQPGGAFGRRDRENTWDSGRCESGKTGSLHCPPYQKKLDPIGRKKNLEHAFAPGGDPDRLPTDFRRVIIIDDIYTTGNTVDQVAKVLKTMGLQKVYFLTISIGQGY